MDFEVREGLRIARSRPERIIGIYLDYTVALGTCNFSFKDSASAFEGAGGEADAGGKRRRRPVKG